MVMVMVSLLLSYLACQIHHLTLCFNIILILTKFSFILTTIFIKFIFIFTDIHIVIDLVMSA